MCASLIPMAAAADNLTLNKSNYGPNEEIIATVTNIGVDLDLIGVYEKGAGAGIMEYWTAVTLTGESQVVEGSLYAPSWDGDYDVRLYDVDGNLVGSVPITVGNTATAGTQEPDTEEPDTQEPDAEEPVKQDPSQQGRENAKPRVVLHAVIRDFKQDFKLFEGIVDYGTQGLVADTLGSDHKPVFNIAKWYETYGDDASEAMINAFYNDVGGVNMRTNKTITLDADAGGYYVIDSSVDEMGGHSDGYFPIDNQLFGNEGNHHNFHFSTEIHATFQYQPGDTFDFSGDDDVWVFFNNKLCVDLGGVHPEQSASVSIDALVAEGKLNVKPGDYISFDIFHMERHLTASNMYMRTNINFVSFESSDYSTVLLLDAYKNDLVPERLMDENMILPVYRDEFAAVAIKLYEKLSGKKAAAAPADTFVDTKDEDVLKAYALNIISGMGDGKFEPRTMLNREQAAVMLTNVFKAVYWDGWNRDTAASYTAHKLDISGATTFSDDASISDWAKDSVYFMVKNGIINGVGDNTFAPRNITPEETAAQYANATREQSLIISVRTFENAGKIAG